MSEPSGPPENPRPVKNSVPPARRPKTGTKRVRTARLDTSASGIGEGELPDQTFFPEGEDFDEDEEEYDEEPDEDGVFAFARPITAAPGARLPPSEYYDSAPTTAGTHLTGGTFGGFGSVRNHRELPNKIAPTGNIDVGGHVPELTYDSTNPPPFSGKHNPNNSSFAFSVLSRGTSRHSTGTSDGWRPNTDRSLMDRLYRRKLNTASTGMTGTTEASGMTGITEATRSSFESGTNSDAVSFTTETTGTGRLRGPRRMRSNQPLINGSASEIMSDAGTRRGVFRGSYGMTEMTGDMTVPDGKVTWGDGMGGIIKETGENGEANLQGVDMDMAEEDSPYPEVRASVSNIDDPEMPGELQSDPGC